VLCSAVDRRLGRVERWAGDGEVASRPFAAGRERQLRSVLAAGITIEG
jgi:hypothetical protein